MKARSADLKNPIFRTKQSHGLLLRYGHLKFSKMAAGHHLGSDPVESSVVDQKETIDVLVGDSSFRF